MTGPTRLCASLAGAAGPAALAGACLLVALACARPVSAQRVEGTVLDAATSQPLQGVLVSLLNLNGDRVRAVLSDDAGAFAFDLDGFGRFTLRAQRIGLEPTTSEAFDVFGTRPTTRRILMGQRAVEIAGLVVDSRVEQCRLDPGEGVQIQRWWQEVRTALGVAQAVQDQGLARFEVARFERQWDRDLEDMVGSTSRSELAMASRPFVSAEADFLVEGGFVQGDGAGQREYYAPDGEVLLSDVFLATHCFSVTENEDDRALLGLSFRPNRRDERPDISGTLWVDTTSAELRSLDYRYEHLDWLPDHEAGGRVAFDYLPSGAWIVREWAIRMPRMGQTIVGNRFRVRLTGYTEVGGEVHPLEITPWTTDPDAPRGSIRGVVWDSVSHRGLADAVVRVVGTPLEAPTDRAGEFILTGVPVGEHRIAFFHDEPTAWGLGSSLVEVRVRENRTSDVELGVPRFRTAARVICMGTGSDVETVLVGRVVDREDEPFVNTEVTVGWVDLMRDGTPVAGEVRVRTDASGRYVVCLTGGDRTVRVQVRVQEQSFDVFEVHLPVEDIVFRQVRLPLSRGAGDGGPPLAR